MIIYSLKNVNKASKWKENDHQHGCCAFEKGWQLFTSLFSLCWVDEKVISCHIFLKQDVLKQVRWIAVF
jgi:hypothetical protein